MSSPVLSGHISGQVLMIEGGMEGESTGISELPVDMQLFPRPTAQFAGKSVTALYLVNGIHIPWISPVMCYSMAPDMF
jgi:hypothetical protein